MKTYLKLVHVEISRFKYVLLGIIVLMAGWQLAGTKLKLDAKMQMANSIMQAEGMALDQYVHAHGLLRIHEVTYNGHTLLSAAAAMTTLFLYSVVIWYRDWYGRSSFIYRLLMLPSSRFSIYMAKFTAMGVLALVLFSLQAILLLAEGWMYHAEVPEEMQEILWRSGIGLGDMSLLMPVGFSGFMLLFFMGAVFLLMLFTTILLERSYRLKGAVAGGAYTLLMIVANDIIIRNAGGGYMLFPSEWLLIFWLLAAMNAAASLLLGRWLIHSKITV